MRFDRKNSKIPILTYEPAFMFELFVCQLLNHNAEPSTQLWEGTPPLLRGGEGHGPLCQSAGYGPVEPSHLY